MFNADGLLNDVRDVKVGMTNASLFAYVADGRNGLRVVELMAGYHRPVPWLFTAALAPAGRDQAHARGGAGGHPRARSRSGGG